jgi:hypothetical protein
MVCGMETMSDLKVGFLGAGKLGAFLASELVKSGLRKQNLFLSIKGGEETKKRISNYGLQACLVSNKSLIDDSDLIFIGLRPQQSSFLAECNFKPETTLVSLMAGIRLEKIRTLSKCKEILRMMCSAPETFRVGLGASLMIGESTKAESLAVSISSVIYKASDESTLDIFSSIVNAPLLLGMSRNYESSGKKIIEFLSRYLDKTTISSDEFYDWTTQVAERLLEAGLMSEYVAYGKTKEGVLEKVLNSYYENEDIQAALKTGIEKAQILALN